MKLTRIVFISILALTSVFTATAQSGEYWGCAAVDIKCQLEAVATATKADPKKPENYYNFGVVFQRAQAHEDAIEAYTIFISIPGVKAERLADAYNNRGIARRILKRPDLAVADYTRAIELDPQKSRFYINRGNANNDLKNVTQARADYDRAIALEPRSGFAYAQRGNFLFGQSQENDALKDLAKAIELDPTYPESYYNRGVILSGRNEYERAIADFDKYIPLIADNAQYLADAHINRGIAHSYVGNREKALADFTKVIAIAPSWPRGYLARALLYRQMKKDDLAAADEKKAATLR